MAMENVTMSTLMGGVSASNLADAAMLSKIMVPEMERQGYNRAFASAVTGAGSLITPIIPPGIALIIYGMVADVSIGRMFMARILAGILCAVSLMVAMWIISVIRGYQPVLQALPKTKEVGKATINAWPALLLLIGVVGGIRANIFTPTEAGAAGLVLVTLIGFLVYTQQRLQHLPTSMVSHAGAPGSIVLCIISCAASAL